MAKEWRKLMSVGHATTRIAHINADLIRELIPNASAKTIIGGKWSLDKDKRVLVLEIKEFDKWE